jgi:transcriptional regulator with XRE-family HTH domain
VVAWLSGPAGSCRCDPELSGVRGAYRPGGVATLAAHHTQRGSVVGTTFAARLNRLFDTVYPPGRRPHTSAEMIAALKAEGITMSAPYLSQLRSGNRTNPSAATMKAVANFFRIRPEYFTDDDYFEELNRELTWLAQMRDDGVRRIAARTVGLSPHAQQKIVEQVDELRRLEHLDN